MAEEFLLRVLRAIHHAQANLQWRPGKEIEHLAKRISLGHLRPDATLETYEALIRTVLRTPDAQVYVFSYGGNDYPSVVADIEHQSWLVMLDMDGGMETAFVIEQPQKYLFSPRLRFLGLYQELSQ
jgi:hypothetical protein